ncbi:MAG: hypothetical protein ACYDCK_06455 [Thermoplasmatota archaeon]
MRRITISCPGCRREFEKIPIDQAERVLFHGCDDCRTGNRRISHFQGRNTSR